MVTSEDVETAKPPGAGRTSAAISFAARAPEVDVRALETCADVTRVDKGDSTTLVPRGDDVPAELQPAASAVTIAMPTVRAVACPVLRTESPED